MLELELRIAKHTMHLKSRSSYIAIVRCLRENLAYAVEVISMRAVESLIRVKALKKLIRLYMQIHARTAGAGSSGLEQNL